MLSTFAPTYVIISQHHETIDSLIRYNNAYDMTEIQKLRALIDQKSYTHLVFDLDATIASIHLPWSEGYKVLDAALVNHGKPSFHRAIVHENRVFGRVFNEYLDAYPQALPIVLEWARDFETLSTGYTPHADLVAALTTFAAEGKRLALWTSNVHSTAHHVLGELEVLDMFSAFATRENVVRIKPNPEGWQHIYDGTPLEKWLFIGDSSNDRHAAAAVGIDYFNVTHFK